MRRLTAEEKALWRKVVESVRPLEGRATPPAEAGASLALDARPNSRPVKAVPKPAARTAPGTTLDASWDKRLARGLVPPDRIVDLHGHNLATAWALIDGQLEAAIAGGDRLVLLVTGKPPSEDHRPARRGAIRAAVGDWLAASRHAGDIAAVRGAHPRHGGTGALYIVLRRRRFS
ncbi:Smr/MutS family protein [Sphingosinicella sp. LHD-64]|uniref:Smr/MutS family protein n=1 Tax=Sphingosinicella sp. LHD-64 TaxID=3072139 RepID=UPI00280E35CC|nr:Smr/MutS family protein [Sphingosinicella sp. LHD-64]MDQ8755031.1 Smr/MutS family protein [Sphingosinicella sp. LHD-64]